MALFGAAASPLIVLAIPAAVLTGMAFATPIAAFAATQRTPDKFNAIFRFGITPLFLFSGTFFPISNLPAAIQPIAWLSPLWHGVELAAPSRSGRSARRRASPSPTSRSSSAIFVAGSRLGVPDGRSAGWPADDGLVAAALARCSRSAAAGRASWSSATSTSTATSWIVILSGFFEPLFYLGSIGFGLGALVGHGQRARAASRSPYQLFVAPALLASAAMNGAITEGTFNFFFKLRYNKTFDAILATPLSAGDVAVGELVWALIRGGDLRDRVPGRDGVLGLVVSPCADPRPAGRAADRVRVRRRSAWRPRRSCGPGRTST